VGEKAGIKAAQDTMKLAESPKEVARAAQLAGAKAGKTRAYLKVLGRGALLGVTTLWTLASWLFSLAMVLLSFLVSIKATTERLTYAWLRRKKARRAAKFAAAQNGALALAPSAG
jgi:hypothetical protein